MATNPTGWFDLGLKPSGWFDETAEAAGWFDETAVVITSGGGAQQITGAGNIASAEAIGVPVIASAIAAAGISSGEAFGAASVSATVSAAGISGGETVSAPDVSAGISAAGIASGEAIGDQGVSAVIASAGIASAEEIGQPVVSIPGAAWDIFVAGIASEELFGLATVAPYVEPEFIGGCAVTPLRFLPAHRIGGAGRIPSTEVFGRPLIASGMRSARRRAREMRELSGRWI